MSCIQEATGNLTPNGHNMTKEEAEAYIEACLRQEEARIRKTRKAPQKPSKRKIRASHNSSHSTKQNRKGRIHKQ